MVRDNQEFTVLTQSAVPTPRVIPAKAGIQRGWAVRGIPSPLVGEG